MGEVVGIHEYDQARSCDAAAWVRLDVARARIALRFHQDHGFECVTLAAAARVLRNNR